MVVRNWKYRFFENTFFYPHFCPLLLRKSMEKAKMADLKLKIAALTVMLTIVVSIMSVSATNKTPLCKYSPYDLNQDGIIDMKDVLIFRCAWLSATGDANFSPRCDFNGDGTIDISDGAALALHWTLSLKANVFIFPRTLCLKSHGNWITCVILIHARINASDIDISSIKLNNTIPVSSDAPVCKFSHCLMVKFSREAVITLIRGSLDSKVSVSCDKTIRVTLTVSGLLSSGLEFTGSDTIRVIHGDTCKP